MRRVFFRKQLTALYVFLMIVGVQENAFSQTFCTDANSSRFAGNIDGYRYELWNQNGQGTGCMTVGEGALFSGEWGEVENYLARRGLEYNSTQEHQEIGSFYATYDCNYQPSAASGNSYLSIYGWTKNPLIEYYIIEDWKNWIPSMAYGATLKGTFSANGSVYEIYENTRYNQPSIEGNTTFQQYFSIRTDERSSGTINISDHFAEWESLGMELGKMYEVSFVVEGYQSRGTFEFNALEIIASDEPLTVENKTIAFQTTTQNQELIVTMEESFNGSIEIYDITSKLVYSQRNVNENSVIIPNLRKGVYILKIQDADNVQLEKIVIN